MCACLYDGGSWMDGMECHWCGLGGLFFFSFFLLGLGRGVFAVIWCGHWCRKEDGKEVFRACRFMVPYVGVAANTVGGYDWYRR